MRRFLSAVGLTVALVAATAGPAAGQMLPPDPPLAASSNVHLLGHIPGTAAGMNFKDPTHT